MFDRLVESEPKGAVRSRRNYFAITSVVMGVLSLTAIVISIFADDYSIGRGGIELADLITPVEMAQLQPDQPEPKPRLQPTQLTSTLPQREVAMAQVDDTRVIPTTISTAPNKNLSIPDDGRFTNGPIDTNPAGMPSGESGRGTSPGSGNETRGLSTQPIAVVTDEPPPPVKEEPKVVKIVSLGVINGQATSLPTPAYPAPARAVGASGKVDVQVLIDESGRVVSAHAASGHPLLKAAAERAAMAARFTPTLLSKVPVKVTGIITYNFMRS